MSIGPRFIGLCGPKHGGKDTVAQMIIDRDPRYRRVAFADILKSMALAINPMIEFHPNGSHTWSRIPLSEIVAKYGWELAKEVAEIRRFLQRLGTEGAREHLGPSVWVNATFDKYVWPILNMAGADHDPTARFVFTDVRFQSEITAVKHFGGHAAAGELWRIDRPEVEDGDPHPSEREWREAKPDWVIENHGDLDGLRASVDALVPLHRPR